MAEVDPVTTPTPDEAAATVERLTQRPKGGVVWSPKELADRSLVAGYREACAERDALRAEVERANGYAKSLRNSRRQALETAEAAHVMIDRLRARLAAQQPVIDAAEEYVEIGGKWSHNELVRAVDAYRAASGSVEADTPAEPDVPPLCACGHDFEDHAARCQGFVARRPCWCRSYRPEDEREVAGTPAAEPAPDREAVLAEAARVITYAIGDADVLDMQGDDLYRHFGQAVLDDLLERPDLLRALAGAGAPTEPSSYRLRSETWDGDSCGGCGRAPVEHCPSCRRCGANEHDVDWLVTLAEERES